MLFRYYRPDEDIGSFVSSYYSVTFDDPVSDVMRAEIANVRFLVAGSITTGIGGNLRTITSPATLLCGPTNKASTVEFSADCHVFGAAVTPVGWARLFDVPADELADTVVPMEPHMTRGDPGLVAKILAATDDAARVRLCDRLFGGMADLAKPINHVFLDEVTAWITSPESNELADLIDRIDLSSRQIERLSKKYFGSSPKTLHRKFRALNSANRLTWNELTDWQDVASTHYYDQPHFIREFKHFNGRTPSEFIKGTHLLVRTTLQERLQIAHESPFSLIG